jgi:hypothetical protein
MAETIVQTKGQPDLRMVEIDHPLGGIGTEELDQRVEMAVRLATEFVERPE